MTFPQIAPRHEDLNRNGTRGQQMVLLRFRNAITRARAQDFLRIRLRRDQFQRCEPTVVPRALEAACPRCKTAMLRTGEFTFRCQQRRCLNRGRLFSAAPPRGVVKLLMPPDFTTADGTLTGVVLVLDRRYEADVLSTVHRTACQLGETLGIGVL